ncbi:hypothetical protein GCM10009864_60700 [Streptomyces lunalinharesii]|uniref:Uncharacterized protein n=1 Tax=Streptomyces lunalinharesii TaxID=333384 RepID=A0ABP6F0Q5_9ACTN
MPYRSRSLSNSSRRPTDAAAKRPSSRAHPRSPRAAAEASAPTSTSANDRAGPTSSLTTTKPSASAPSSVGPPSPHESAAASEVKELRPSGVPLNTFTNTLLAPSCSRQRSTVLRGLLPTTTGSATAASTTSLAVRSAARMIEFIPSHCHPGANQVDPSAPEHRSTGPPEYRSTVGVGQRRAVPRDANPRSRSRAPATPAGLPAVPGWLISSSSASRPMAMPSGPSSEAISAARLI